MAEDNENPLIKALPPATDYISYLTLIEHNLTKEQLPTLHKVLQDTTLTINIGWDLVHILLPLLPESEACLRDVARLGNPREVVLKVTELLEEIGREEEEDEDDEQAEEDAEEGEDPQAATMHTSPKSLPPSKSTRFSTLLSLLSILHPRIKTKYPSRFLSTSLQAILSAYTSPGLPSNTLCASAILDFTRQLAPGGSKRPNVPPRKSSSSIATLQAFQSTQRANQSLSSDSAPDPEANTDGVDAGEEALQRRLLQSFMTYVAEVYLSRMPDDDDADEDAPGMCWASRYMEMLEPKKIVPGRRTMSDLYSDEDKPYHERDTVVGSILAQSRDLSLSPQELLTTILKPIHPSTEPQPEEAEDDTTSTLPSSPSDVPLSTPGALYILTATLASPLLFHRHHNPPTPPIELPTYPTLLTSLLPSPTSPSLGTEPPSYLDALFFLGLHVYQTDRTAPRTFPTSALQQLTMLSSRLPSPRQRYTAHTLASGLLHSHPDAVERLGYIKDTLQHCPYENVRAEGVGWVKDEIVDAAAHNQRPAKEEAESGGGEASPAAAAFFLTPNLLPDLSAFLFVSPAAEHDDPKEGGGDDEDEAITTFQSLIPFHLAVLNLILLIFSNPHIKSKLNADAMSQTIREWIMALEKEISRCEDRTRGETGEMGGMGEMDIVRVNCRMCLDKLGEDAAAETAEKTSG